jgi:hypothetical protein
MATSTIDGIVEEAVITRHRSQGSFYERIKFRLDDGSTRTWRKAHVLNNVAVLLAPGTRGRFYLFKAIDHRGVSGVRTADGQEAFGVAKLNEYVFLGLVAFNLLLTIFYATVMKDDVSSFARAIALVLMILGVPFYFIFRQNRVEAERAFRADAGFRPPAAVA